MQINKEVYDKTDYKNTIFVGENLWINIKIIYLYKLFSQAQKEVKFK
jgi:hypothetical protein